jgi:acyl dehydratase
MSNAGPPHTPGTRLPALILPPMELAVLERYAAASGDHARIHLDDETARAAGFPGVIAHGLLVMAYLGRAVCGWYPDGVLRNFSCRFMAVTLLGDRLSCCGTVVTSTMSATELIIELDISVIDQRGEMKLKGTARIAAPAIQMRTTA